MNAPIKNSICVLSALMALATARAFGETYSYHIGNSITWDSQPLGIEAIAGLRGRDHSAGHHILFSSSLNDIWTKPTTTSLPPVDEFGAFEVALPAHRWNAVTLQPWPRDATLGQDVARVLDFIDLTRTNPENHDTEFFIFTPWPRIDRLGTQWLSNVVDDLDTRSSTTREYYQLLAQHVRDATDANVFLIPTGEVFFQLNQRIQAGELPGVTHSFRLYRDAIHASYSVGRYIAGVTTYATLFREDPAGLTAPEDFYSSDSPLFTQELYEAIHETVWQVVREHSFMFDGDFDGNGLVEQGDLDLVLGNWGISADPAPQRWVFQLPSGMIDQDELDQVLAHWGGPAPPAGVLGARAVPEPGAAGLMLWLSLLWYASPARRRWTRRG